MQECLIFVCFGGLGIGHRRILFGASSRRRSLSSSSSARRRTMSPMVSTRRVMVSTRKTTTRTPGLRPSGAMDLSCWQDLLAIGRIRKHALVWCGVLVPSPLFVQRSLHLRFETRRSERGLYVTVKHSMDNSRCMVMVAYGSAHAFSYRAFKKHPESHVRTGPACLLAHWFAFWFWVCEARHGDPQR